MTPKSQNELRPLRREEVSLIRVLLGHVEGSEPLLQGLEHAQVRDMDDGGMGSLEFAGDEQRYPGSSVVKAEYLDCDGGMVSIALNADNRGQLYELDMWKVDFAPLQEYPSAERVTIKP